MEKLLTEAEVDAFVFFDLANIRYLADFTGTDGVLVVNREGATFLTDSRYQTQARQQVSAESVICYQKKLDGLVAELQRLGVHRVGFESESLTVATWEELQNKTAGKIDWVGIAKPIRSLRSIKDREEIAALEHAALLNQKAFDEIIPLLKPGTTEREIALALEFALKTLGGEEKAFDFIVASGERGAMPHGLASDKPLNSGELVTIDFGTRVAGYHSDETVTVAIGAVEQKLRDIYDTVLAAHDLALAAVKPGIGILELDAVAREYITGKGYGDFFGHGLGHGLGLKVHEFPALSPTSGGDMEEGMVVTIEPGIYMPKIGGARIEDTVVVTAEGCRCLTRIAKKFQQFPA
ncbi:MAG: Xaa-Pro peptidase family protein [Desulfuromonadales bacterium]|nr:Xaa-Pro peptidase family protein [Desulfuromonadales bacterium]